MEAKTESKKIILEAPQGEVIQFASYGLMKWGVDESGKKFVKWGETEWLPSDPNESEEKEKKEEKMEEK